MFNDVTMLTTTLLPLRLSDILGLSINSFNFSLPSALLSRELSQVTIVTSWTASHYVILTKRVSKYVIAFVKNERGYAESSLSSVSKRL